MAVDSVFAVHSMRKGAATYCGDTRCGSRKSEQYWYQHEPLAWWKKLGLFLVHPFVR